MNFLPWQRGEMDLSICRTASSGASAPGWKVAPSARSLLGTRHRSRRVKALLPTTCSIAMVCGTLGGCRDNAAAPAPVPIPGRIAFVSDRRLNQQDIWLMNADGSVQLVTNHLAQDDWPSWSPDGTHIAFESDRALNFDIYTTTLDGSVVVRLTADTAFDGQPAWSPDGAFAIYVMNAKGGGVVKLTTSAVPDELPAWSPDGQYIAFDSDADIYMMKADGTELRRLTSGQETDIMPRWQP